MRNGLECDSLTVGGSNAQNQTTNHFGQLSRSPSECGGASSLSEKPLFTDPDSRIMKNSTNAGFDQHYNAQVAVEQDSFLIVANGFSNHPNDKAEALPTLDALAPELGRPAAAALDNGFFSETNIAGMEARGIEPYIATGREPHHKSWRALVADQPAPPPVDATPKVKMAYKLQTVIGQAIYRLRKCTVEPVIGIVKEILGFRHASRPCAAGLPPLGNGVWCAWPSI